MAEIGDIHPWFATSSSARAYPPGCEAEGCLRPRYRHVITRGGQIKWLCKQHADAETYAMESRGLTRSYLDA